MQCRNCPGDRIAVEGRSYGINELVEDLVCEGCGATAVFVQAAGQTTVVGPIDPPSGLSL